MKMTPLQAAAILLAATLSSCTITTTNEIPAGHPRTVVLKEDLPLRRNPLRDRQVGSTTEDPNNPPLGVVKRGTRVSFDALLCEKVGPTQDAYLLCRTHEGTPRIFEYYAGEGCRIRYNSPTPWDMPAGHSFKWVPPQPPKNTFKAPWQ